VRRLLAFLILFGVHALSKIFYRGNFHWKGAHPTAPWTKIRLIIFLNHTSLYEPLFLQVFSLPYLWHLAGHVNVPAADITLSRPIVGTFWKLMVPRISSVSRKMDKTWSNYLRTIRPEDIIMIAPEGRMKRPGGLDKYGKPMTVKGGVADIIEVLGHGGMALCMSGGLHHVQSPGQILPRPFKKINMDLYYIDIKDYLESFPENPRERKIAMIRDLQRRLTQDCPSEVR
jgi:Acyltransferase